MKWKSRKVIKIKKATSPSQWKSSKRERPWEKPEYIFLIKLQISSKKHIFEILLLKAIMNKTNWISKHRTGLFVSMFVTHFVNSV